MLDCSTRLTVAAFLGALVALPSVSDADMKVSRGVISSKGAFASSGALGGRGGVASKGVFAAPSAFSGKGAAPSRGVVAPKPTVSQPFGSRGSGGGAPERRPPTTVTLGNDQDRYGGRGGNGDRDGSRDNDRDRYSDHGHDRDRHGDWDDHGHGHDNDRYHGHKNCDHHDHHHGWYYGNYYPYYPSTIFLGFGVPAYYTPPVGYGPVGYWCEHCHYYATSVQIFYDHVHLAHGIVVGAIPGLLVWNPVNLTFVFD